MYVVNLKQIIKHEYMVANASACSVNTLMTFSVDNNLVVFEHSFQFAKGKYDFFLSFKWRKYQRVINIDVLIFFSLIFYHKILTSI